MLCNLVPCIPDKGAKRLDQFGEHRKAEGGVGEPSSTGVPCKEGLEDESMCEDDREDADDKDVDEESKSPSSSGSAQESPCSTHHYSDRSCHPHSWAEWSELGNGEDGSLGGLSISQDSGGKGESEVGCQPALTSSPLCEQESSSQSLEAAPQETTSTVGDLLLTGSQDAVIIHATEDELRSLD